MLSSQTARELELAARPRASDEAPAGGLREARAAARSGDWTRAAQLYRHVLGEVPDQLEALEGLGLAALQTERPAEALDWLRRAQRHCPDNAAS